MSGRQIVAHRIYYQLRVRHMTAMPHHIKHLQGAVAQVAVQILAHLHRCQRVVPVLQDQAGHGHLGQVGAVVGKKGGAGKHAGVTRLRVDGVDHLQRALAGAGGCRDRAQRHAFDRQRAGGNGGVGAALDRRHARSRRPIGIYWRCLQNAGFSTGQVYQ